jgi:hypothetical protein
MIFALVIGCARKRITKSIKRAGRGFLAVRDGTFSIAPMMGDASDLCTKAVPSAGAAQHLCRGQINVTS